MRKIGRFNFDEFISRENTNSVKWNFIKEHTGDGDVLPLWVADMDFETVPEIKDALNRRTLHGIYGYTARPDEYYRSLVNWIRKRHGWTIEKEWIRHSTGVVNALFNSIYALSSPGDGIIIQPPVYHPFRRAIDKSGRKAILNPLKHEDGKYYFDLEGLEKILKTEKAALLILCSPHNPVGRVYTKEELKQLGEISLKYGLKIISDEIHSDFIYKGHKFVPFASISGDFAQNSVTCTAPSKTFNLAGLSTSNIIIPNSSLREKYSDYCESISLKDFNIFGAIASQAAYEYGEPWLEELLVYLEGNKDFAVEYIEKNIPELKVTKPEGTYFLWVDFRELGFNKEELESFLLKNAKVWFNQGYIFGEEGEGFARINLACRRAVLREAVERIGSAVEKLKGSKSHAYAASEDNKL